MSETAIPYGAYYTCLNCGFKNFPLSEEKSFTYICPNCSEEAELEWTDTPDGGIGQTWEITCDRCAMVWTMPKEATKAVCPRCFKEEDLTIPNKN